VIVNTTVAPETGPDGELVCVSVVLTLNVLPTSVFDGAVNVWAVGEIAGATVSYSENSEVLPAGSVAVAVMSDPTGAALGTVMENVTLPAASVVTVAAPR